MDNTLYIAAGASVLALIFAVIKYFGIMSKDAGTEKMQKISKLVQDGAAAFLKAEYKWLTVFVIDSVVVLLSWVVNCKGRYPS